MVSKSLKNKTVLITCGPTWIPIDSMRIISNRSSGQLGQEIAHLCLTSGAKVTLIQGPVDEAHTTKQKKLNVIDFQFYDELAATLKKELKKHYDIMIHAAAVSDYKLKNSFKKKLSSNRKQLQLTLVPTQKIINIIKRRAPKTLLVGFKLEDRLTQHVLKNKTKSLFTNARCDLVVANSVKRGYKGYLVDKDYRIVAQATSRNQMARKLVTVLKQV